MTEEQKPAAASVKITEFVIAKIGDTYAKFSSIDEVPEGATPVTSAEVAEMTKDQIDKLYGQVAKISPKKFKSKVVALESLIYQINKLHDFGSNGSAPSAVAAAVIAGNVTPKKPAAEKKEKTSDGTIVLQTPPNVDELLKKLAPQAKAIVLVMTELAKEKKSASFSVAALEEKLKTAEAVALLHTKQDPLRVLQYYKGKLITLGFIRVS